MGHICQKQRQEEVVEVLTAPHSQASSYYDYRLGSRLEHVSKPLNPALSSPRWVHRMSIYGSHHLGLTPWI